MYEVVDVDEGQRVVCKLCKASDIIRVLETFLESNKVSLDCYKQRSSI